MPITYHREKYDHSDRHHFELEWDDDNQFINVLLDGHDIQAIYRGEQLVWKPTA